MTEMCFRDGGFVTRIIFTFLVYKWNYNRGLIPWLTIKDENIILIIDVIDTANLNVELKTNGVMRES